MKKTIRPLIVLALALLAGCTWTPYATTETSAAAKQFTVNPDAATIYVYRSAYGRPDENSILYMDGLVVGSTRAGTFYRIETAPARHVFHGIGLDPGYAAVDARAGQIYFVRLDVIAGESRFKLQSDAVGRKQVLTCCELLETWPWAHLSLMR